MREEFDFDIWKKLYQQTHDAFRREDYSRGNELKAIVSSYLDKCGLHMPKEKYPYDKNDQSTWKFLESKSLKRHEWTELNPNWKYKEQAMRDGVF